MSTYSRSEDLVLDTGKSLDAFFDVDLTDIEKKKQKEASRERAFNKINDEFLRGKTAVPALHIPGLKQVEIDLVIADLMAASFTMETANSSEWQMKYEERALKALERIRFGASVKDATPEDDNTGTGLISNIEVNDEFTLTEKWILRASSAGKFAVSGSLHGYLQEITVGTKYPEKDWSGLYSDYGLSFQKSPRFEQYPISLLITAGDVAFVRDDKFVFKTYAASFFKQRTGQLLRG